MALSRAPSFDRSIREEITPAIAFLTILREEFVVVSIRLLLILVPMLLLPR